MKIFDSLEYRAHTPCVLVLGCFDGVHAGHAEVIKRGKETAESKKLSLTVWSFDIPPKYFFTKEKPSLITETDEKKELIEKLGADTFVCVPFNADTANIEPDVFFHEILKNRLKAEHIVCGFNFTFGAKGRGNTDLLKRLCQESRMGITVVPPIQTESVTVSSTEIRSALEAGEIEKANLLLGRSYSVSAPVVDGQHLARRLGFPTANQIYPKNKAVLKYGVYATTAEVNGRYYFGISNVGIRPTVNQSTLCVETHLFDFNGDLYGKNITVEFLRFLRPEAKFGSVEELAEQVKKDIEKAKELLLII